MNVSVTQDETNRRIYHASGVVLRYASQDIEPSEMVALMRYQQHFNDRDVLDIGVGTGRTTRSLATLARRYVGIDYSPVMVSHARKACPNAEILNGDVRDLKMFLPAAFDSVLATNNVLDALSHADRLKALREIRRVMKIGGVLIFSSHNRNYSQALGGPRFKWSKSPIGLARSALVWFRSARNHIKIKGLRKFERDFALINDTGHEYAVLHYYITEAALATQLDLCSFQLLEVLNNDGEWFPPASRDTSRWGWLMYVACARES